MFKEIFTQLDYAWEIISFSNERIIWNLFLAYIPLLLSIILFRKYSARSISWSWWVIFAVFLAFLPNAPYVLTDIVHVIDFVVKGFSVWTVTLIVIPQYFIFILFGFEAYVISLINLDYYLQLSGKKNYSLAVEIIIHALCAIGIYLGRFNRFNSWNFITHPEELTNSIIINLSQPRAILIMIITFIILTVFYWLMKQVTLSLIFRFRYKQ